MRCLFALFVLIILQSCFLSNKKISIEGIAKDAKLGAVVLTDNGEVYYIYGMDGWDKEILGKRVTASGILDEKDWGKPEAIDEDVIEEQIDSSQYIGLDSIPVQTDIPKVPLAVSGPVGIQKIIKDPRWEIVEKKN